MLQASVTSALCGISSLEEKQSTKLKVFLNGNNVFAQLPTGFGKSLTMFHGLLSRHVSIEFPDGSV